MKRSLLVGLAVVLAIPLSLALSSRAEKLAAADSVTMIAHNVFFSLKDNSPEAKQKLVAACKKYLSDHPGTVFFAAGTVAEFDRPVNDRDFDVGLHLVFKDKDSHDKYQDAAKHKQFIAENNANWKKVRVFDSRVEK
jgi:hypothetical protein